MTHTTYLQAFTDWFRACDEAGTEDAAAIAALRPCWEDVVEVVAASAAPLPEEAGIRTFCERYKGAIVCGPDGQRAARLRLGIAKSNYLWRRLYRGEAHRSERCPVHGGVWTGITLASDQGCPCGLTGWLPESLRKE